MFPTDPNAPKRANDSGRYLPMRVDAVQAIGHFVVVSTSATPPEGGPRIWPNVTYWSVN